MRQFTVIAVKTDFNNEVIGYRIKGTKQMGGKVLDVSAGQLAGLMAKSGDISDNLKLIGGKLELTNGNWKRYTDLSRLGSMTGSESLVVLDKYILKSKGITAFNISNYTGNTMLADEELALILFRQYGIANGKLVNRNGKYSVSSIQGEYPTEELTGESEKAALSILRSASLAEKEEYAPETITEADRIKQRQIEESERRLIERTRAMERRNTAADLIEKEAAHINDDIMPEMEIDGRYYTVEPMPAQVTMVPIKTGDAFLNKKGFAHKILNINIPVMRGGQPVETPILATEFFNDKGEKATTAVWMVGYILKDAKTGEQKCIAFNTAITVTELKDRNVVAMAKDRQVPDKKRNKNEPFIIEDFSIYRDSPELYMKQLGVNGIGEATLLMYTKEAVNVNMERQKNKLSGKRNRPKIIDALGLAIDHANNIADGAKFIVDN